MRPNCSAARKSQPLLDHSAKDAPKLVEDLVPKLLPLSTVQRVLQNLLEEGVHIRDMRTIIETLAEHAAAHAGSGRTDRRRCASRSAARSSSSSIPAPRAKCR